MALRKSKKNATLGRQLITVTEPQSFISEQFRTIKSNIMFCEIEHEIKTIVVTSSTPAEGKSTVASNLAVVFAQEGKKVLLVDADMRKPILHHTFQTFNAVGLSSILSRKIDFKTTVQETKIENLHVITCGKLPPFPTELLASNNLNLFIQEVSEQYDIIIFDAPPLLAISDAHILASKCDGTLLVINSGKVDKSEALKAKKYLEASKSRILGVVLNNYPINTKSNYYYSYNSTES